MASGHVLRALHKSALEHGLFLVKLNLPCFEKRDVRTHFVCLEGKGGEGRKAKANSCCGMFVLVLIIVNLVPS